MSQTGIDPYHILDNKGKVLEGIVVQFNVYYVLN